MNVSHGRAAEWKFKLGNTNTLTHFYIQEDTTNKRFCLEETGGNLVVQYSLDGSTYIFPATLISGVQTNTWYVARFIADDNAGFTMTVYQENNPVVAGSFTLKMPSGINWRFMMALYNGTIYVDDFREFSWLQPDAVTHQNGVVKYTYDANGSMITRTDAAGVVWNYAYNLENELTTVTRNGVSYATFVYDEAGRQVKETVNGKTTVHVSGLYEYEVGGAKRWYYAGAGGVKALRVENDPLPANNGLFYILPDPLGGANVTIRADGSRYGELRYSAWGSTRYAYGTTQTENRFTGQREDSYINLYWFGSRWYDPELKRFLSPDSIVPDPYNPLDWDRFSFVRNNPVNYTDPTGHRPSCDGCGLDFSPDVNEYASIFGLSFTGEWIEDQKWTIIATSALIGNEISNAIGQGLGAAATFVNAFGNLTILSVSRGIICSGCLGQEAYPEIRFIASQVSARLVAHEFGHAFEKAIWRRNGSAYAGTLNPIQFLSSEGAVRDVLNGFVTGFATDPSDGKSRYRRWNGPAPQNGYYSDFIPEQYHGRDFDDWNDVHEGWADMFLNWTFGTFYPNLAGTAMDTWVTTNMADWVNSGR